VLGKREVMDRAQPSFISSSYWTDGMGAAAALAVLNKMQRKNIQPSVWRKGEDFTKQLTEVAAAYPKLGLAISGLPVAPMLTFTSGDLAPVMKMRLIEEMLTRNFLLGTIIYLMDAHRDADLQRFLVALKESLEVVADEQARGALRGRKTLSATTIGRLA
jgi:glutamate-1-semialdehyde 2,1-aminomutase